MSPKLMNRSQVNLNLKIYDHQPHAQIILLAAMDASKASCRLSRRYFPCCIAWLDICSDVDENVS